jgi:hypothetical protein
MLRGWAYILEYAERPDGHGGLELARHGGQNRSVWLKANFAVFEGEKNFVPINAKGSDRKTGEERK